MDSDHATVVGRFNDKIKLFLNILLSKPTTCFDTKGFVDRFTDFLDNLKGFGATA